jgi:ParB-like chromosome segregation protein Spo0J
MRQIDLFETQYDDTTIWDIDISNAIETMKQMPPDTRIEWLNKIRLALHQVSPMKEEPVDCVVWVKNSLVSANDYNPNSVAPPEMELLRTSIASDGYTQPIVTYKHDEIYEVVDGFHRHRVGKECEDIQNRIHGYLPVVAINGDRQDKGDRIAATIRHNRARGKHRVEAMSDIVLDLRKRNWNDQKIARELGMDADEVLRLAQITGLAEMFADRDFSEAWEASFDEQEAESIIEEEI